MVVNLVDAFYLPAIFSTGVQGRLILIGNFSEQLHISED